MVLDEYKFAIRWAKADIPLPTAIVDGHYTRIVSLAQGKVLRFKDNDYRVLVGIHNSEAEAFKSCINSSYAREIIVGPLAPWHQQVVQMYALSLGLDLDEETCKPTSS